MTVATENLTHRAQTALYTYAWAVDSGDLDTLAGLVVDDVTISQNSGDSHGREKFLDVYRAFAASDVEVSRHVISNVLVRSEDDGTARVDAYFEATMFRAEGTQRIFGRYSDSLVDADGELRVVHKRIRVDRVLDLPAASAAFRSFGSEG